MVIGLDIFREYFSDYKDCYVIIGGTACDIIFEDEGFVPRATDDIDIILIVEALTPDFITKFWQFVREGDYKTQQKETERRNAYRFAMPTNKAFPKQIELFSRTPDAIDLKDTAHLTPIPVDEGLSSLSAILLNEDYYHYTIKNSVVKDGVHYAEPHTLLCLKAYAYLSNKALKKAGKNIHTNNIVKHKKDVFRLLLVLRTDEVFETPDSIKKHLQAFADDVKNDLPQSDIYKDNGFGTQNMPTVFNTLIKSFNLTIND